MKARVSSPYGVIMYGILENNKIIAKFATPLSVVSNVPTFVNDSMSLKRNASRRAAQRWEVTAQLEPLSHTANDLFVLLATKGSSEWLEITTPQNYGVISKREINGTTKPIAYGAVNSSNITIQSNHIIPRGAFIRFLNHTKVYMLTEDVIVGSTVCGIFPSLRASVSGITFSWQEDVVMPVYLETTCVRGMTFTDGILMNNGELKFVEAL